MCKHEHLELRGNQYPENRDPNTLYLLSPSLVCLDCHAHLMNTPDDVTRIGNIPHPTPLECEHPIENRAYPLAGFGSFTCLQCGQKFGPTAPTTELSFEIEARPRITVTPTGNVGIGLVK